MVERGPGPERNTRCQNSGVCLGVRFRRASRDLVVRFEECCSQRVEVIKSDLAIATVYLAIVVSMLFLMAHVFGDIANIFAFFVFGGMRCIRPTVCFEVCSRPRSSNIVFQRRLVDLEHLTF